MEQVVETLGGWVGFWDLWEMKMRGGTLGRVKVEKLESEAGMREVGGKEDGREESRRQASKGG